MTNPINSPFGGLVDEKRKKGLAAARFALATVALALALLLTWPIYDRFVGKTAYTRDIAWTSYDDWAQRWQLGGFVVGAVVVSGVLVLVRITAIFRRESVWMLSSGSNLGVAAGCVLIAGVLFPGIHAEHAEQRYKQLQQMVAAESYRQQEISGQDEAGARAKAAEGQRRSANATQLMEQLKPGSVASTLAAADAQSPSTVIYWLRDGFVPFLERHPWPTLGDDDRAAFGAFAGHILKTMGRNGTDSEVSVVAGRLIAAEHGPADTSGAMDECARLHAATSCRDEVVWLWKDPLLQPLAAQPATSQPATAQFTDCQDGCPQMVVIPAGSFTMGSPDGEKGRTPGEGPQHTVAIRSFAVGKYDVTFAQWDACVASGGCNGYRPDDQAWGRDNRPVVNVSWADAQSYVQWLSGKTGKRYRLLSESEWEYAARAGTTTAYYWGDDAGSGHANCSRCGSHWDSQETSPAGSFAPNAFGLYDMAGDVWQWVQDCYTDYSGAPSNGAAVESAVCDWRVVRGGSYERGPEDLRSAKRMGDTPASRGGNSIGFRVARDLSRAAAETSPVPRPSASKKRARANIRLN